jgi:hypothetical protein
LQGREAGESSNSGAWFSRGGDRESSFPGKGIGNLGSGGDYEENRLVDRRMRAKKSGVFLASRRSNPRLREEREAPMRIRFACLEAKGIENVSGGIESK